MRVLGQRVLERLLLGQEAAVGLEERAMPWVVPVDPLEHHLAGERAIEHERRGVACVGRRDEHVAGDLARQQLPHFRRAVVSFDDRAVAQDEGQRTRQRVDDRPGEVEAASGGQRHLDPGLDRQADRLAIGRRQTARDCREWCRRYRAKAGGSSWALACTPIVSSPLRLPPSAFGLQSFSLDASDPPQNCTRISPTTWRFTMSPNTCCCTS